EWRGGVLPYAGALLSKEGPEKVDGLFYALLGRRRTELKDPAHFAGLLRVTSAPLKRLGDKQREARLPWLMDTGKAGFDPEKGARLPLKVRVEAAEALGQAGGPRLRENRWVRIPAGRFLMHEGHNAQEVDLDTFEIGRYPVTVEEYGRYVD